MVKTFYPLWDALRSNFTSHKLCIFSPLWWMVLLHVVCRLNCAWWVMYPTCDVGCVTVLVAFNTEPSDLSSKRKK